MRASSQAAPEEPGPPRPPVVTSGRAGAPSAAGRRRRLPPLALAAILALGTFGVLQWTPAPDFHVDTVEDQLAARQCAPLGGCELKPPGYPDLYKGTLWIRLVAAAQRLSSGAHVLLLWEGVLALYALGVATLFLGAARLGGRAAGVVIALGGLAWLLVIRQSYVLWNPTLVPPATALLVVAALWAILRPGGWRAGIAGVTFALACEIHPEVLVFGPVLVVALSAAARGALWHGAVAALAALLTHALLSAEALGGNLRILGERPVTIAVLVTGAELVVAAAFMTRRWARSLTGRQRARWALAGWLASYALAAAALFARRGEAELRYLVPLGPVVLLAAARPIRTLALRPGPQARRVALALLVALLLAGALAERRFGPGRWRQRDVERVASLLAQEGFGYQDVFATTQGHNAWLLAPALGVYLPARDRPPRPEAHAFLRVAAASLPRTLPPGWTVLPEDGRFRTIWRRLTPSILLAGVVRCYRPSDDSPGRWCVRADQLEPWSHAAGRGGFVRLRRPDLATAEVTSRRDLVDRVVQPGRGYRVEFELPVAGGQDGWRHLFVGGNADGVPFDRLDQCAWRIVAAPGLRTAGELGGQELWFAGAGALVVEGRCREDSYHFEPVFLPALTETAPAERILREWLRAERLDPPGA